MTAGAELPSVGVSTLFQSGSSQLQKSQNFSRLQAAHTYSTPARDGDTSWCHAWRTGVGFGQQTANKSRQIVQSGENHYKLQHALLL
jgi:hypothetical protein